MMRHLSSVDDDDDDDDDAVQSRLKVLAKAKWWRLSGEMLVPLDGRPPVTHARPDEAS